MLQLTNRLSLCNPSPASATTLPSCELAIDGQPAGLRVTGCVLEAALQHAGGYLLFLTDDILYEDSLNIHLIDGHGELKDSARLGGMYASGYFEQLQIHPPDRVSFRFIGDTRWTVRLLAAPACRWPFFSEPVGVHRAFGCRRHFMLTRQP